MGLYGEHFSKFWNEKRKEFTGYQIGFTVYPALGRGHLARGTEFDIRIAGPPLSRVSDPDEFYPDPIFENKPGWNWPFTVFLPT